MQRPGYVTFAIFALLVGGAIGTFISINVLVFDPILHSQAQTKQQASFENLIFAISTIDSVLSVIAGIGMILARNWARILGAVLFMSTPFIFLLQYVTEPAAFEVFRFLVIATSASTLYISLGVALLISKRSRRYFGVLVETNKIITPPPPPQFD